MTEFKLHCETCSFERTTASLDDALDIEADHKAQHGSAHRVSIKRQPKP
jgi:hypothetical protein